MAKNGRDKNDKAAVPRQPDKAVKSTAGKKAAGLLPVEELARAHAMPAWELAGLMRAAGWAEGKQMTASEFAKALERFRKRPQGGGRL